MPEPDDMELLAQFARNHAEPAFAALVARYVNLVHSTALRSTGNAHAAEEVTQAVFIILARKAGGLGAPISLSGWLYQTTRLTAANFLRTEIRRQKREQEAYMQSLLNEPAAEAWGRIAPLLDDALGKLGERDRHAIVLRFFENKTLGEVGAALGASEDAAKMRVNRALEKLRKLFARRGIALSTALIAGAVAANSVQAAPAGLAQSVSLAVAAKGVAGGSTTLTLAKGTLKLMAWTKIKTAAVAGVIVLLAAGSAVVVDTKLHPKPSATDLSWADDPRSWRLDQPYIDRLPPVFIFRRTRFFHGGEGSSAGFVNRSQNDAAYTNDFAGYKFMGKNLGVPELIQAAYGGNKLRMVLPDHLPGGSYDVLCTLPKDGQARFQAELKRRLSLTAHFEKRTENIWLLRVADPGAPGLKPSAGSTAPQMEMKTNGKDSEATISGYKISDLLPIWEEYLGRPVTDQTGLTDFYDIHLKWKSAKGAAGAAAFQQALRDQLGLELVSATEPVDVLVVEKVKN